MKNLYKYCVVLAIILIGCDDKINSLEELNTLPEIEFFSRKTTDWTFLTEKIIDSAKIYTEQNNANYSIALRTKDLNNNFESIIIKSPQTGGLFFIDNELFENEKTVALDSFSVSYRYFAKDVRAFKVLSKDDFNKILEIEFEIHFIENIKPNSSLEIRSQNINGIVEHVLDGSFSIDGDASFGGRIIEYEFTIDDILISSDVSTIMHVFEKGTHSISLRVKDNDGEWSNVINKTLIVN